RPAFAPPRPTNKPHRASTVSPGTPHRRSPAYEFRVVPPLPQAGARRWSVLTTHAEAPLALRQGNGAQDALGNQALHGALARVLAQMVAYTQFDSSLPAGAHHGHGVIQRRGPGFFHQHMLASTRRSERLRGVQGVR